MNKNSLLYKKKILKFKKSFLKNNEIYLKDSSKSLYKFLNIFDIYYSTVHNLKYINIYIVIKLPEYISKFEKIEQKEYLINAFINNLIRDTFNSIELIESSYTTIDNIKNKVHSILSIKPLFPSNNQIINNIFNMCNLLFGKKNILYIKELKKKKSLLYFFHKIKQYDIKTHNINLYTLVSGDLIDIYPTILDSIEKVPEYGEKLNIEPVVNKFYLLPIYNFSIINEMYLLYLWKIYFLIKNYYFYYDNQTKNIYIYIDDKNCKYTYYKLSSFEYLLNNNDKIIYELINTFYIQLKGISLNNKVSIYLEKSFSLIPVYYGEYFPNIKVDHNLIEFKNGLYFINNDIFIESSILENDLPKKNYYSLIYIDKLYEKNKFINNNFFIELINKIKKYFKIGYSYDREKNLNIFLLKVSEICNKSLIFKNELYIDLNNKILFIIGYMKNLLNEHVSSYYKFEILNIITPFFILMKLYQNNYNNMDLFYDSIVNHNKESNIYTEFFNYHPKITDYHLENFKIFFCTLNNFYIEKINESDGLINEKIKNLLFNKENE